MSKNSRTDDSLREKLYVVRSWLSKVRMSFPRCLLCHCCLHDGGTIDVRERWASWNRTSPSFLYWHKPKSIKNPTEWNSFFQSVEVSLFRISRNIRAFLARIKRLFEQSHTLLFPRSLYQSTAILQETTWEGGRKEEIADRQTKGWEWTSNIANVCVLPCTISVGFIMKILAMWVMWLAL